MITFLDSCDEVNEFKLAVAVLYDAVTLANITFLVFWEAV